MKVLLPTSGIGSRLRHLTQFTNKSLVQLGDKLAICYIIELYPVDTEFVITLGHFGDLVKQFLTIAYPERTFIFVNVDNFDGPGSSLGYSILKARQHLQCPFVFHCCDTIIREVPVTAGNVMYVSKSPDTISYSSVATVDSFVVKVNMKGAVGDYLSYVGVSHIEDYNEFWDYLAAQEQTSSLSDVNALADMVANGHIIKAKTIDFYDTGNLHSYMMAKAKHPSLYNILEKPNESLCFFPDKVIKFSADASINEKRVIRTKFLCNTPRILGHTPNFLSMEFVKGTILSDYPVYGQVKELLEWSKTNLWVDSRQDPSFLETCKKFYYDKTLERISKVTCVQSNVVNGIHTGSIHDVLKRIDFDKLSTDTFYRFHGDFILDNIIKTADGFCLIDWRHEFGNNLEYGDMYYDIAKLRHNIIFNHKNVSMGLFTYEKGYADIKCNYFLIRQLEEFDEFVKSNGLDLDKVKIIMALIWLNMSPLYTGTLQAFLFHFAKFMLHIQVRP